MEVTTIGLPSTPKPSGSNQNQSKSSLQAARQLNTFMFQQTSSHILSASTTNRLAQILKKHPAAIVAVANQQQQQTGGSRSGGLFTPNGFAMTVKRYQQSQGSSGHRNISGIISNNPRNTEQFEKKSNGNELLSNIEELIANNQEGTSEFTEQYEPISIINNQTQQQLMEPIQMNLATMGNYLVPKLHTRSIAHRTFKKIRLRSRGDTDEEDSANYEGIGIISRDNSPTVIEKMNQPLNLKNQTYMSMSVNPSALGHNSSNQVSQKPECFLFTAGGPPPMIIQQPRKEFIISNPTTKIRVRSSSIQQQNMIQQRKLQNKILEKHLLSSQQNVSSSSVALQITQSFMSPLEFKNSCIASIRGPILLSAPHSAKILRGGYHSQTKERIHLREQYVSTILLQLAYLIEQIQKDRNADKNKSNHYTRTQNSQYINKVSLLFWNKEKKFDKFTLDPNYLVRAQFKDSPFHQALHKFVETQAGIDIAKEKQSNKIVQAFTPLQAPLPLFHLDIHGKKDRKHNMDIDLGTRSMREDFKQEDQEGFVEKIISSFVQNMSDVFENVEFKNMQVKCNPQGELVGKWGTGNMHTMTHQSVLLGIPAMQIEFPKSIRHLLIREPSYLLKLAHCILNTYENVIVPAWQSKKTELLINYSISKQLVETKLHHDKLKEMAEEYQQWDKKIEGGEQLI